MRQFLALYFHGAGSRGIFGLAYLVIYAFLCDDTSIRQQPDRRPQIFQGGERSTDIFSVCRLSLIYHTIINAYPSVLFIGSIDKPISRLAAVLVLLFERDDHLRVLLTTRAKQLRIHGGETSLPGGKMEDGDKDIIATAVRFFLLDVFSECRSCTNSRYISSAKLLRRSAYQ